MTTVSRIRAPWGVVYGVTLNSALTMDVLSELQTFYRIVPRRQPLIPEKHRPRPEEGKITSWDLIAAAQEFDELSEGTKWDAEDFAAWFVAEVKGSSEWKWLEKHRTG